MRSGPWRFLPPRHISHLPTIPGFSPASMPSLAVSSVPLGSLLGSAGSAAASHQRRAESGECSGPVSPAWGCTGGRASDRALGQQPSKRHPPTRHPGPRSRARRHHRPLTHRAWPGPPPRPSRITPAPGPAPAAWSPHAPWQTSSALALTVTALGPNNREWVEEGGWGAGDGALLRGAPGIPARRHRQPRARPG